MSIFTDVGNIESAIGMYLTFNDTTMKMFDDLKQCNARKRVDIVVEYNGIIKEYKVDEFLSLLGFAKDELELSRACRPAS